MSWLGVRVEFFRVVLREDFSANLGFSYGEKSDASLGCRAAAALEARAARGVGENHHHMRRPLWDGLTIRPTVALSARGHQHEAPASVLPLRPHAIGYAPLASAAGW